MKPGYKTTEMWLTLIGSVLALLVGYGALSIEESALWYGVAVAFVPLAIAIMVGLYSYGRAKVKSNQE